MGERLKPSQVFGDRLRAARKHRALTQDALASRMRDLGFRTMSQSSVVRIERGEGVRGLTLDEALGLAAALSASPTMLLTPSIYAEDDTRHDDLGIEVALTNRHSTDATRIRDWLRTGRLERADEDVFVAGRASDRLRERFEQLIARRAEVLLDAVRAGDSEGVNDIVNEIVLDVHRYQAAAEGGNE